jgi:hypothetical protein
MTAALPMNLIDLPMNKELDRTAMQNLVGGHSSGYNVKTSYYTSKQTQSYGFLKRHRYVRHYTRVTTQKWHVNGRWGSWHIHF